MPVESLLLKAHKINKSFGITRALKDADLELEYGQIHGLIGENGSGKSTLASIIAVIQPADSGEIFLDGQPYKPVDSLEAQRQGICMILQEKGTFDNLSVSRNIFIGKENFFSFGGMINIPRMNAAAQKILEKIHAGHIKAAWPITALSFEDRKLVEVARAMYAEPKVLIADETTTALSRNGREILYRIMRDMKKEGHSVIFISHDLDELINVCDSLTILRDGEYVKTFEKKEFVTSVIRHLMVGREVAGNYYRTDMDSCKNPETVFSMEHVYSQKLRDITFDLRKGEILGLGGLAECGMHEIGNIAFGLIPPDLGIVKAGDDKVVINPVKATSLGIAYLSKNRDTESLMTSANIVDNICLASYKKIQKNLFIWNKDEREFAKAWGKKLEIKMTNIHQYVIELSGGNKQKVALAKWLGFGADVLIMDCPTRGIDIGVKVNIYQLMTELKNQGKSIILISEELPEIIGMSDRIIILKDGRIKGEFSREEKVTECKLVDYMI